MLEWYDFAIFGYSAHSSLLTIHYSLTLLFRYFADEIGENLLPGHYSLTIQYPLGKCKVFTTGARCPVSPTISITSPHTSLKYSRLAQGLQYRDMVEQTEFQFQPSRRLEDVVNYEDVKDFCLSM